MPSCELVAFIAIYVLDNNNLCEYDKNVWPRKSQQPGCPVNLPLTGMMAYRAPKAV
jgi:hypothetical protein